MVDLDGLALPDMAMLHAADPTDGGTDGPLYVVEAHGNSSGKNIGRLESNSSQACSKYLRSNANGSWRLDDTSMRIEGWLRHNGSPGGVQVYVDEADSYKLKAILPSTTDVFVPLVARAENNREYYPAGALLKIEYAASVSGMKPLYFRGDNGPNEQLRFAAADTSNHNIPGDQFTEVSMTATSP